MDFSSIDSNSYDKYTFGQCIRQQREEKDLSVRQAASRIGISAAYLSDIEKGKRYAPVNKDNIDKTYKILKVLNVSEDQTKYAMDMAYATHGCSKEMVDYLTECEHARKFIRLASELELSADDWDSFIEQLDEKRKAKTYTVGKK